MIFKIEKQILFLGRNTQYFFLNRTRIRQSQSKCQEDFFLELDKVILEVM